MNIDKIQAPAARSGSEPGRLHTTTRLATNAQSLAPQLQHTSAYMTLDQLPESGRHWAGLIRRIGARNVGLRWALRLGYQDVATRLSWVAAPKGRTALVAARYGRKDILHSQLAKMQGKHASLTRANAALSKDGKNLVRTAAENGIETLEVLHAFSGIRDADDGKGNFALAQGSERLDPKTRASVGRIHSRWNDNLAAAIERRDLKIVIRMLDTPGMIDLEDAKDSQGYWPLHRALDAGDADILSLLLDRGAKDMPDKHQLTAFDHALLAGSPWAEHLAPLNEHRLQETPLPHLSPKGLLDEVTSLRRALNLGPLPQATQEALSAALQHHAEPPEFEFMARCLRHYPQDRLLDEAEVVALFNLGCHFAQCNHEENALRDRLSVGGSPRPGMTTELEILDAFAGNLQFAVPGTTSLQSAVLQQDIGKVALLGHDLQLRDTDNASSTNAQDHAVQAVRQAAPGDEAKALKILQFVSEIHNRDRTEAWTDHPRAVDPALFEDELRAHGHDGMLEKHPTEVLEMAAGMWQRLPPGSSGIDHLLLCVGIAAAFKDAGHDMPSLIRQVIAQGRTDLEGARDTLALLKSLEFDLAPRAYAPSLASASLPPSTPVSRRTPDSSFARLSLGDTGLTWDTLLANTLDAAKARMEATVTPPPIK